MDSKKCFLLILQLSGMSCMDKVIEELLTPLRQMGETCGYASCPLQQKDVLNVHIVPHTHGELGGTRTFFEHYTGHDNIFMKSQINMKRILDFTITELYTHSGRTFTLSDMPFFFHWWANRDETVRRMVYTLLRQGRLYLVGGGWSMSDEATTSYHAVIDHFTYSLRKINATFLECGRPLVAWQADCYGHSREFASLLSQMGFDGVFINPISFDDELERMQRKGMEFLWRGSDDLGADSDIFAHKLFDGYWAPPGFCFGGQCSDPLIITSSDDFANYEERVLKFIESVQHRQSPYYSTRNVMVMMGQKFGYYDASLWFENIDKLIKFVNIHNMNTNAGVNAFYSTPACYLKAVYSENPKLQTKQDDFFPFAHDKGAYGTGYFTARPSLKYLAREGHVFLQICKQLLVTSRLSGDYNKFFEEFSWINGVFQDHTIITGGLRPHVVQYYVARMSKQIILATKGIIKDAFNKFRGGPSINYYKCRFNISSCLSTGGPHYFVMVYNPLAWNVTVAVRLPSPPLVYEVFDPQGNQVTAAQAPVPRHILRHPENRTKVNNELIFYAVDLPPMGYRSYCIVLRYASGWIRPKRSLIKKINQKKPKKYLVRQTNTVSEDDILFDDNESEYTEIDSTTNRLETRIVFGNVSKIDYQSKFTGVLTPKSRIESTTTDRITTESDTLTSTVKSTTETSTTEASTTEKSSTSTTEGTTASTTTTTQKVTETTKRIHEFKADENKLVPKGYPALLSEKPYFNNKYIRVNLDKNRRIRSILLANGLKISLDIKFFYYVSDDPAKLNKDITPPGVYLFRTMDEQQEEIFDRTWFNATLRKSKIHREYECVLSKYASFVLKLYANTSVLEIDWMIGPIPVEDGLGKEVFIKYATNLDNQGVFYTDANGRQTMKRIRDTRPTFKPLNPDPIAGNIYPVTSKIHIVDTTKNIRFSVFTDRAQGGSSLKDGEINLMVHRRLLTDDTGIQAYINETESNEGLMIRGTHYLYISKADHRPTRVFEKKLAKEIELKPKVFVSNMYAFGRETKEIWLKQNNEFSALKTKLPVGVHILTLEKWNWNTLLLRLENFLEREDVVLTGIKTVKLKGLFKSFDIKRVQETTLSGHMWLKDHVSLNWNKHKFLKNFNEGYGSNSYEYAQDKRRAVEDIDLDKGIVLEPQQIRTFVVWYDLIEK